MNKNYQTSLSVLVSLVLGMTAMFTACSPAPPVDNEPVESKALGPPPLKMLLVDTPDVGEAIRRQWSARRDGELTVTEVSASDFSENEYAMANEYDVVVYPSGELGDLVYTQRLIEIPKTVWGSDSFNKKELLRQSRTTQVRFGSKNWGTPLGSSQFVLFYRQDVLDALKVNVPNTWEEFYKIAERLKAQNDLVDGEGNSLPTKIDVPLADSWAVQSFLAVAASRTRERGKISTVFHMDTLEPLVAKTPFVTALSELKGVEVQERATPEEVYAGVLNGTTAMAISWPSAGFENGSDASNVPIGIAPIPGSKVWFDDRENVWLKRPVPERVDFYGVSSRTVSVLQSTGEPLAAFDFITWLSSKQIGLQIFPASPKGAPYRASHLGNVAMWTGELIPPLAIEQYEEILLESDSSSLNFVFPRVIQQSEYLAILDTAIIKFLENGTDPQAALDEVVVQWERLTDTIGRDKQKSWLRKSEGL